MKVLYNFVEAETGFDMGNYNQMALPHPPGKGDLVGISLDGVSGEAMFTVEGFTLHIHDDFDGQRTEIVDVHLRPVDAKH